MRDIKFRAWREKQKFMLQPHSLIELFTYGELVNPDEVIWMQYTGLKDKNGVEIYDGDVIHDGDDYYQVEYSDCNASFITTGGSDDDLMCATHNSLFEVIGNIHQNPELLEGKQ